MIKVLSKHVLNAVSSPTSNGQVERYNRTILNSLRAQNMRNDEEYWDNDLGRIQWGLNNTVQKTTGKRPAELMFGSIMNGEISPCLNEIAVETREDVDLLLIRTQAKEKIDLEQDKQKQRYDQNRHPARTYDEEDLVKVSKVSLVKVSNEEDLVKVTKVYNDGNYKKKKKLLPT